MHHRRGASRDGGEGALSPRDVARIVWQVRRDIGSLRFAHRDAFTQEALRGFEVMLGQVPTPYEARRRVASVAWIALGIAIGLIGSAFLPRPW